MAGTRKDNVITRQESYTSGRRTTGVASNYEHLSQRRVPSWAFAVVLWVGMRLQIIEGRSFRK